MPKYNNISNIPAKTFFDILKSKNYQLLKPKPREKDLEQVFISIYDEFFIKSDNHEAKRYLELTKDIAFYKYKIATLKQSIHFYFYNKTTEKMRLDFIDAMKQGYGIEISKEVPFIEEVERVLTIEIGIINNDLNFAQIEFDEMINKSKNKDFDYYDSIGALSNVLPNNSLLKEDMSLAVYVTLEKQAQQIVEQQNNKKKK
jgi:hypothetical protein